MRQALRPSALVPRGFVVDGTSSDGPGLVIAVRPVSRTSKCPGCGTNSERVHSRYCRRLADLPLAGRPVRLVVVARRFHCDAVLCGRRIFVERFDLDVLAPWARRTARLDHIVHHLGLALGGRPAASFARRLMLPVSNDTLLRVVRRHGSPRFVPPTVVGIDDWVATQPALRDDRVRSRAAQDNRVAAGSRAGNGTGLAFRSAADRGRRTRSRWRLRSGGDQGAAAGDPGR